MKTIVIAQGKGGVGKTACAAHIAYYGREAGLRVLAIDLDTGNLSKTLATEPGAIAASQLFDDETNLNCLAAKQTEGADCEIDVITADSRLANLVYMPLDRAITNFAQNLKRLNTDYDLCVIDTAPGLGIALAAALHAADAVISPVEMEEYSIEGIKYMMRTIVSAKQRNSSLAFLGIVPSRVDRRNPRQVKNLNQMQQAQAGLLVPFVIGLRSSVAEALSKRIPVWKLRKTTARQAGAEMRALGEYVLTKMGVNNEN